MGRALPYLWGRRFPAIWKHQENVIEKPENCKQRLKLEGKKSDIVKPETYLPFKGRRKADL